jgi:beta-glucosidase/6-phospho-beta-glucosidase/beta-galactosidase
VIHDLFCEQYKLPEGKPGIDFVGINYYSEELIKGGWKPPFVSMGNDLYAHGIEDALVGASRYGLPLMITENGVADSTDAIRPSFITEHIAALDQARSVLTVPLLGYLHWSLTDNFEWSSGFSVRYGLVEMDYATLQRKPRSSYFVYRDIIAAHHSNGNGATATADKN